MPIIEAIQKLNSQHEIFSLLSAYIEGLSSCDEPNFVPWELRHLPLGGADDVKARIICLRLRLRGMASDANLGDRLLIVEAIEVFQTALRCLAYLQGNDGLPQAA